MLRRRASPTCATSKPKWSERWGSTARATCTSTSLVPSAGARRAMRPFASRAWPCSAASFPCSRRRPARCGRTPIRKPEPVEAYLRLQQRFAHLFAGGQPEHGAHRQAAGNRRSQRRALPRSCGPEGAPMNKPFAITLDEGSEPGEPHRRVAHPTSGIRRSLAAVQRRVPRRRERPALALSRRGGRLPRGVGGHPARTIRSRP